MAGKGKKFLFGCAIGCGALLLLGVGSCIGFSVWINRPGELLEPRRLFSPGTTGYVEWTLTAEDPGSRAFVTHLYDRSQSEAGDPNVPAIFRQLLAQGRSRNRDNVLQALPILVLWTMQAGEPGGEDQHLLSISVERLGNRLSFMDWTFGLMFRFSPEVQTIRHGRERLYVVDGKAGDFTFFIHDQSLFFTTDVESAENAVDRLDQPASEAVVSKLGDVFASLPETALRGVVSNTNGALAGIWDWIAGVDRDSAGDIEQENEGDTGRPRPDWSSIRLVTLSGGLTGPSSFAGTIEFHCVDANWAATHADRFVEALRTDYRRAHLPIETEVSTEGDRIRVLVRMDDVPAFLDEL